jgi:hypothetical protein
LGSLSVVLWFAVLVLVILSIRQFAFSGCVYCTAVIMGFGFERARDSTGAAPSQSQSQQPRFKEKSTWQIPEFEVITTRGLAWTRFSRSLSKKYLQEVNFFFNLDFQLFFA